MWLAVTQQLTRQMDIAYYNFSVTKTYLLCTMYVFVLYVNKIKNTL